MKWLFQQHMFRQITRYNCIQIYICVTFDLIKLMLFLQLELNVDMEDCLSALVKWREVATDNHVNLFTEVHMMYTTIPFIDLESKIETVVTSSFH